MKDELGRQIVKELVGLIAKTYRYLKVNNDEDKKAKDTNKCAIKRTIKFEDYKNCIEAGQIENKMNQLEKNEIEVNGPDEFIKSNKLTLKTQQRFNSEWYNVFTDKINNI